jgi:hypothetical protein
MVSRSAPSSSPGTPCRECCRSWRGPVDRCLGEREDMRSPRRLQWASSRSAAARAARGSRRRASTLRIS